MNLSFKSVSASECPLHAEGFKCAFLGGVTCLVYVCVTE